MTNKQLLPLLILMVIFSPLAIDIFLPALPMMAKEFFVPMTQMQWSITILASTYRDWRSNNLWLSFYHVCLFR